MRLVYLKNIIGFTLVILHIAAIALCFILLDSRLGNEDFRLTILILVPVTAAYGTAFVKDMIRNNFIVSAKRSRGPLVSWSFTVLSILFSAGFSLLVIWTIMQYANNSDMSPDDLKDRLALVEVMAGGFLGLVVETLFGHMTKPEASARQE